MKICDNFITDQELLAEIRNDSSFFPESMGEEEVVNYSINQYHDNKSHHYSPYMFWDGWWSSPADTLKKRVIKNIWEDNLPLPFEDICGFEYWVKTFKSGQYLKPHVDEDTYLYKEYQVFSGPTVGCVYYPDHESVDGGYLELHEHRIENGEILSLEREKIENAISPIERRERIAFKPNRLVIFDAGHILHGTTPTLSGTRRVLIVNVWSNNNKPLALVKNSFHIESPSKNER